MENTMSIQTIVDKLKDFDVEMTPNRKKIIADNVENYGLPANEIILSEDDTIQFSKIYMESD